MHSVNLQNGNLLESITFAPLLNAMKQAWRVAAKEEEFLRACFFPLSTWQ